jgi:carboxypeptidase PM20D1
MKILIIALAILVIFLAIILIRALLFRPAPRSHTAVAEIPALPSEKAARDLAAMIQCQTVSNLDWSKVDEAEFARFYELLAERYPLVHKHCPLTRVDRAGLVYRWPGERSSDPIVLMAHYDVVPVEMEKWEKPPFAGIIEDGVLWGRGSLDTKCTLCAVMAAAEHLLAEGFVPPRDIYFSFGGDEEVQGQSAIAIVSWLEERGLRPALVLDEGGVIVEGVFPGVSAPCALVGVAEKGTNFVECRLESAGGHGSMPPPSTAAGQLARAIARIERHPFPGELTAPVAAMYDQLGRHASFGYRLVYANLWCSLPILKLLGRKNGGALGALLHTTCAVTRMEGSQSFNVLPTTASFGLDLRLLGQTTSAKAIARLKKVMKDEAIKITVVGGSDPSPVSDMECREYQALTATIAATWPEALVSPYLMMAATDSRHFCRISDRVYRFSPLAMSKEQRASVHSHNERLPLESLDKMLEFYIRLIKAL